MSEIFHIARALAGNFPYPAVMATLVGVTGSSYRREGARRLIPADGDAWGAISGGCLEADLDERARKLINSPSRFELVSYDTENENDILWGTGAGCEGVVRILLEKIESRPAWVDEVLLARDERRQIRVAVDFDGNAGHGTGCPGEVAKSPTEFFSQFITPPVQLIIFGAGDDAIPLCGLAHELGWMKKISDPRPNLLTTDRFPHADDLVHAPAGSAAAQFRWDDWTAAIVMTHRYQSDLDLLRTLLPLHLKFLGLLGPRSRGQRLMREAGFDPADVDLHNPVGLDLGGDGAEAIALAAVAEIQAVFSGRSGHPLRERSQPIHHDA